MVDPPTTPFTEPDSSTMGTGSLGDERTMGGAVDPEFYYRPLPDGPGPSDATLILPQWRLSIYWAGDDEDPTDYLDRPNSSLSGALPIVTDWGQVVQQAKSVTSFDTFTFRVGNVPDAASGDRFSDTWSVADPPEGKRVELYLLVGSSWVIQFTGRIVEIQSQDELEVSVLCGSIAEALDRPLLRPITSEDWPSAPSASLQRFQPVVFGAVPRVEGVLVQENLSAALGSSLTSTATTLELAEDPGFGASGSVRIDMEELTYATKDAGPPVTLQGVVRGVNGTVAADHPVGSQVHEVGPVTWLVSVHASSLSNPMLLDSAGNLRAIPDDIVVTMDAGPPATVQLSEQPVLSSLGVESSRTFKFIDTDTVDTANTAAGFTEDEVAVIAGRSEQYTETNYVTLSALDNAQRFVAVRRDAPITIPEGATIARAYVVVEHYLPSGAQQVTTALSAALNATATTVLVDSVTGFPSTGTLYIGEERLTYTGLTAIPSPRFTGVTRGTSASGASTHPDNAKVTQSGLEVRLRTDPGFVGLVDGEGFCVTAPTTPEEAVQDAGLQVISKGFENAHTHVVPGNHDHDSDTSHSHVTPVIVEWQPSLVQARSPKAPAFPCSGGPPAWQPMRNLSGEFGNIADRNVSTAVSLEGLPASLLDGVGFYFLRGTSSDASPNDERVVKTVEFSVATSMGTALTPGTITWTWAFNGTLSICELFASQSSSSVGAPELNIGASTFNEAEINTPTGVPGGNGTVLREVFSIPRSVATYVSNPQTIYVDTFTRDVSSANLQVRDFVDLAYGGNTGRSNFTRWRTPALDVHFMSYRLIIDDETGASEAGNLAAEDWPDTDAAAPLQHSTLSWFDVTDRVSSVSDLIGAIIQVNHTNGAPYLADALVLRAMFVLELESVTVSGNTEAPMRLVVDAAGLSGVKATTHMAHIITRAELLGEPSADTVDTASLSAVFPQLQTNSAGVVYDQVGAADLLQEFADQHAITAYWNAQGKLAAEFRAPIGSIGAPVFTFRDKHLLPTVAGPTVSHAPLRDLINQVTVRAMQDPTSPEGWGVTVQAEDTDSQDAYGALRTFELDARFLPNELSAQAAADHVIDYNATLPRRVSFRVHIEDTDTYAPLVGQVVGLETASYTSSALIVERRVVVPGNGRDGRHAFVEYTCVDRSPVE